jgi:hypothetical protein
MFTLIGVSFVSMIILPMYSLSVLTVLILLTCQGRNCALVTFEAQNITDSWVWLIHPLFQLICGWNAANHGYPRIALFSPRSDRKKQRVDRCVPVCTCRLVKYWSSLLRLGDPSMLYSFLDSLRRWMGSCRYFTYCRFMKFSVAPESRSATALALFDFKCIKDWMVIDFLFDINTSVVWVRLISADLIKQG